MKKVVPAPLNPFPFDVSGFASLRHRERGRQTDRNTERQRHRDSDTERQRKRKRQKERERETFQGVGEWVKERKKMCFNLKPMAQVSI